MRYVALAVASAALAFASTAHAGAAPPADATAVTVTPRLVNNVHVTFTNDANRVLRVKVKSGGNPATGAVIVLYPGDSQLFAGGRGTWKLDLQVEWCEKEIRLECAERLSADVKGQNALFGYPSMKVQQDEHGFKAMERYTFEQAYGHGAKRGVAKFKTIRLVDSDSGTKRFNMNFSYAAPAA